MSRDRKGAIKVNKLTTTGAMVCPIETVLQNERYMTLVFRDLLDLASTHNSWSGQCLVSVGLFTA